MAEMRDTSARSLALPLRKTLCFVLAFLPAWILAYHLADNAVNIPVWDDWQRANLIEKAENGTLDFSYLYSPHIDHRILFPRLIILGMNGISGGDIRWEIFASFGFMLIGAVCLWRICLRIFNSDWGAAGVMFLVNAVYFSPVQYQNFLWAIQLAMLLPLGCLGVAVWSMTSPRQPPWLKFLIGVSMAIVATHSFGHGFALWPVIVCLTALVPNFGRGRWPLTVLMILIGAAIMTAYFRIDFKVAEGNFYSYGQAEGETPPGMAFLLEGGHDIDDVLDHMAMTIGNAVARIFHTDPQAVIEECARVLVIAYVLGAIWMLWRWRDESLRAALLPWLALGGYSLASAVMMAIGRSGLSPERAMMTRFISPMMFVTIAVIGIGAVAMHRWMQSNKSRFTSELRRGWAIAIMGVVGTLLMSQWVYGVHKMEAWKYSRLQERVAVLYVKVREPTTPNRINRDFDGAREQILFLDERGWLDPPLVDEMGFGPFEIVEKPMMRKRANFFEHYILDKAGGVLHLSGYAKVNGPPVRIADGVLIGWRRPGEEDWEILGVMEMRAVHAPRAAFMDGHFGSSKSLFDVKDHAGWRGSVEIGELPEGKWEIGAWSLDAERMTATPFKGTLIVE